MNPLDTDHLPPIGARVLWEATDEFCRPATRWCIGELIAFERPSRDLVARIRVESSNFLTVGTVQGVGVHRGVKLVVAPPRGPSPLDPSTATGATLRVIAALSGFGVDDSLDKSPNECTVKNLARADGFDQAAVDAAKAIILAPAPRRR